MVCAGFVIVMVKSLYESMGEAIAVKKLIIGGLAGGGIAIGAGIVSGQIGGAIGMIIGLAMGWAVVATIKIYNMRKRNLQ